MKARGLIDWSFGRFGAACNLVDITRNVAEQPNEVEAVTDQRSSLGVLPESRDRRNTTYQQGLGDCLAVTQEHRACGQNDRLAASGTHCVKRVTIAVLTFHLDHARFQAQLTGCLGCHIALLARDSIECNADGSCPRKHLASDLDPLRGEFKLAHKNTGHIAAGT